MQAPPMKKGWLSKQGRGTGLLMYRSWKRRYFVLELGKITYFEGPNPLNLPSYGESLKGEMRLMNAHVSEPKKDNDKLKKRILISGGEGIETDLLVEADNDKDAKEWLDALRQHCRYASAKDKTPVTPAPVIRKMSSGGNNSGKKITFERSASVNFATPNTSSEYEGSFRTISDNPAFDSNKLYDVTPNPWFVIKVIRKDTRAKVFINVCEHSDVPITNAVRGTSKWPYIMSSPGRIYLDTKENSGILYIYIYIY